MRVAPIGAVALLVGVARAQEFVPDTTGFDASVSVVMALVTTLFVVAVVVGIIAFATEVWLRRGG